jgi:cell division protein FtsI (penicillin-binding protein 3)
MSCNCMVYRNYINRIYIIFCLFFFVTIVVIIRIFLMQVVERDFYCQQSYFQDIPEESAKIFRFPVVDRNMKVLAITQEKPSLYLYAKDIAHGSGLYKFLEARFPWVLKEKRKPFVWLKRHIDDVYEYISPSTPGIFSTQEFSRFYPYSFCNNFIGSVDYDNRGISGIEYFFSRKLEETKWVYSSKNKSRPFPSKQSFKESLNGIKFLRLSIDAALQGLLYEEVEKYVCKLNAELGLAIVMNPLTGEILSMIDCFPLKPKEGIFANHCVSSCYEFGSVMKLFAAVAAFEEGCVKYDEEIDCEGKSTYIDGFKIENPTKQLLQILRENNNIIPFYNVIRYSSNIGIAKIAKRLGSKFYKHLVNLGFGTKTGIEFPGERTGIIYPPDEWSKSTPLAMSFGYELAATPLQLCKAISVIANDGYNVAPTFLHKELDGQDKVLLRKDRLYSQHSVENIKSIMKLIGDKFHIPGVNVFCKTGTARLAEAGGYNENKILCTVAGFIEKGAYKRSVVVFLKEPKKSFSAEKIWAYSTVGPLFKKIINKIAFYDLKAGG